MKGFRFLMLLCLVTTGMKAQKILTAEEALKMGLDYNFDIKIARNETQIAHNNNTLGNAGFLPILTADGTYTRRVENVKQLFATGQTSSKEGAQTNVFSGGTQLSWTVFNGMKVIALGKSLRLLQQQGELQLKQTVVTTSADILRAYFEVGRQQRLLAVQKEAISYSATRADLGKLKYDVGKSSKLDYLQALVDLNSDSSAWLLQQQRLTNAKLSLNELIGLKDENYTATDSFNVSPTLSFDELAKMAGDSNPQLQIASLSRQVGSLNVEIMRGSMFPKIDILTRYNYLNQQAEAGFLLLNQTSGLLYGASLNWTIFNGGVVRKNIQNAKIESENDQLRFNRLSDMISTQLRQAYSLYEVSVKQLSLERQNLKNAFDNLDIATERYRLGRSDILTYRLAQLSYVNARQRYFNALFDVKDQEIKLRELTGK